MNEKKEIKDFLHSKVLIQKDTLYGTVEEVIIVDISPSGEYFKISGCPDKDSWRLKSDYLIIEVLYLHKPKEQTNEDSTTT